MCQSTSTIAVNADLILIAFAVKDGYADSDILTQSYTVKSGGGGSFAATSPAPSADPGSKLVPKDIDEVPWAREPIQDVINRGIMSGYPGEEGAITFKPKNTATRAEIAAIFSRLASGQVIGQV